MSRIASTSSRLLPISIIPTCLGTSAFRGNHQARIRNQVNSTASVGPSHTAPASAPAW